MENISHSLPKRSFSNAAFASHRSVYDDVFGGPPKYGLPTLAPRLEDYSEIFGGFHSSRSSSIPLLDLPLASDDYDLHFDVRTTSFDYDEVFGDFRSLDCTASFEDLFGQSSGGYDSSDEAWSPEQSGSLSDELDPLAGSDKSHRLSDGDVHQSLQSINQFNASYNKSSHRSMETVLAATHNVTNFSAVPGYTFSHYESPVYWDGEDDHCCSMGINDDINHSLEFGGGVRGENQFKCSSNPLHSGFDMHINDYDPLEKHESPTSPPAKPFVTVSDISLRTKPSGLPPPSRPPPVLAIKKGESDGSNSKPEASNAFDRIADESAPLFFDVEIDATICADDRENRNKNVKVKHQGTAEPVERKYTWSYSAMQVEERTNKTDRVNSAIEDEKLIHSHGKKTRVTEPVVEENIETVKSSEATSGSPGVQCCSVSAENSAGAVAWREETDYFEVIEENISRQTFDNVKDDSRMQHMLRDAQEETEYDTFNLKEDCKEFKLTKDAHSWHERNQPEMNREHYESGTMQQKEITDTRMSDQEESPDELIPDKVACAYDANKDIPEPLLQLGEFEKLHIDHGEAFKVQPKAKGNVNEVAATLKLKGSPKTMNIEKLYVDPQNMKRNSEKLNQNIYREEFQRRLADVEGAEINRELVKERTKDEGTEKQHTGPSEELNENKLEENYKLKENAVIPKEGKKNTESREKSYVARGHCKSGDEFLTCEKDMYAGKLRVNDTTEKETLKQNDNVKEHKLIQERDVIKGRNGDATKTGDDILRFRMVESEAGNENFEKMGCRDAGLQGLSGHAEEDEPIERSGIGREVERDLDGHVFIEGDQLKVFKGGYKVDEMIPGKVLGKHDTMEMLEVTQATYSSKGNRELNTVPMVSVYEPETVMDGTLAKGSFDESKKNIDQLQDKNIHHAANRTVESPCLPKKMSDSNSCGTGMGISRVMSSACEYAHEPVKILLNDNGVQKMNSAQSFSKRIDMRDNFHPSHVVRESANNGSKVEDASSLLKHNDAPFSVRNTSQWRDIHMRDSVAAKDQKVGERVRRETTTENEHMRKLEEEWEREREREKDRMAVDKADLEARKRSYSESCEKAHRERAAVERATAEARQRAMAETRERLEKASMETRLRAERAAVERATAEARQRAAEKLMAHKASYVPSDKVERSIPDRFSASSRSTDTRQNYLSSDLHFQSAGISNGWGSHSLAHEGAEGESPQRCKARLERYRRTAERAANALAEKNRRDLIAQREREERNRVAEALDAEVKRWSSGKEGNLRALLSTLQYILGPNSGWHPIPLTEVITSAAVKRAYRKATLCVHPDKLQQRGATIQQKYVSEKVFDLLKEAWNKFNSEER